MDWLTQVVHFFLHLDAYFNDIAAQYGHWTYLILFVTVFCETGLVVTPFLPGDSLLFVVGALCATEGAVLDPLWCFLVLSAAAILGDTVNYTIGTWAGPRAYERGRFRFIKQAHLDKTHAFYERHGGKTIILARFAPILRTFAPFVAGIGQMSYLRFLAFNVVGGLLWPASFLTLGYVFGENPQVKKNFSLVILAIVVLSCLPAAWELFKAWRAKKAAPGA